jgi:hypothetical protein
MTITMTQAFLKVGESDLPVSAVTTLNIIIVLTLSFPSHIPPMLNTSVCHHYSDTGTQISNVKNDLEMFSVVI